MKRLFMVLVVVSLLVPVSTVFAARKKRLRPVQKETQKPIQKPTQKSEVQKPTQKPTQKSAKKGRRSGGRRGLLHRRR